MPQQYSAQVTGMLTKKALGNAEYKSNRNRPSMITETQSNGILFLIETDARDPPLQQGEECAPPSFLNLTTLKA